MPQEDKKKTTPANSNPAASNQVEPGASDGPPSLVDDLGVQDLRSIIFGKHGRLFSAAGRATPVAEMSGEYMVMHPPQKPLEEGGSAEEIVVHADERGILLDALGKPKFISGAKYRGHPVVIMGQRLEGTFRHFVACEIDGTLHRMLIEGEPATHESIYKLRNDTHDGELSKFQDLTLE